MCRPARRGAASSTGTASRADDRRAVGRRRPGRHRRVDVTGLAVASAGFPRRSAGETAIGRCRFSPSSLVAVVAGLIAAGRRVALPAIRRGRRQRASTRSRRPSARSRRTHRRRARLSHARRDPASATGLALTIALGAVIVGGLVLGVLAFLVRANEHAARHRHRRRAMGLRARDARSPTRGLDPHHAARRHARRDRARDRRSPWSRSMRVREPLRGPVPPRRHARQPVITDRGQGSRRPRAPDAEPDRARPSARRSRAATRRPRRRSTPPPRCCSAAAAAARARTLPGRRRGRRSRSRWPARACCSTCTGSPTSSPGSRSAGPGSRSARSRSAAGCCGSARRREAAREADAAAGRDAGRLPRLKV